ncbi:MAG TPA: DUF1761 domain-containing protein [Gemmatimonadales bacterium]|jgi:hypothetical protein|nr:DUF1761 domain-containing protein [Gemmatimonadales bacterium]
MARLSIRPGAVLIAALLGFAIGFIWYSPVLFGGIWMQGHGYTPERLEAMKGSFPMIYGLSFVCQLVMAIVISVLLGLTGASGAAGGAKIGALGWLGFAATTGLTNNLFSDAPLSLFAVDTGYQLVYLVLMGAFLGAWKAREEKR